MTEPDIIIVREDPQPDVVTERYVEVVEIVPSGIGLPGPPGPAGPPGPSGSGAEFYEHVQVPVTSNWLIEHNLGFHPQVWAFDSARSSVEGEVEHLDMNSLIIHFTSAFAGGAYLS